MGLAACTNVFDKQLNLSTTAHEPISARIFVDLIRAALSILIVFWSKRWHRQKLKKQAKCFACLFSSA